MAAVVDDSTTISFPIVKAEETPEGDLLVEGVATDGSVDSDDQIVDPDWSGKALSDWLATGANVRVQHNPHRDPAGVGVEVKVGDDGKHRVRALVVEPVAKDLVRKGVLRAYSVGIMRPRIIHDTQARGGRIVDGEIGELSLVDRPANRNCGVTLVKAAADGSPEFVGKSFGTSDVTGAPDGVMVSLPKDLRLSLSPADLAAIEKHHKESVSTTFSPADMAAKVNAGIVKRDVSQDEREQLARQGKALPDGSYPIRHASDLENAVTLAQSGHGDVPAAKKLIQRRAKELGREDLLPDDWRGTTKGKKPFPGAAEPFKAKPKPDDKPDDDQDEPDEPDGDSDDEDDEDDDEDEAAKAVKPARVPCPKCGKGMKSKASFCSKCGTSMNAEKGATPTAQGKKTKPAGEHREPDGPQAEIFEEDAGMTDGDEKREGDSEPTPTWDKSAALHDALCPAYRLKDARQVHGFKTLGEVLHSDFDDSALADLAGALKSLDADMVKAARRAIHKSFTDMYPTAHVSPTQMTAGRFNRPYIGAGHAPLSAAKPGSEPHAGVSFQQAEADEFRRAYLAAGHQAPSPASQKDDRGTYAAAQQAQAAAAMRTLHDHVSTTRPELCPLAQNPVHAVGQGVPARKSEQDKLLAKQAKQIKRLEKQLGELLAQPDPDAAPMRGILVKNASGGAGPVERRSLVDEAAEAERAEKVAFLTALTKSGDPSQRQDAQAALDKLTR